MNPSSSLGISPTTSTFACVRCSERKVKCNRQNPCSACTRHKVQCIFRAPKPPRRRRKLSRNELFDERLKRYEVLLLEKGIDPNQVTDTSKSQNHDKSSSAGVPQYVWQFPTASTDSTPQETVFKPLLLHGQQGTKFVDNSLWQRVVEEVYPEEALKEEPANHLSGNGMPNNDFTYVLDWNPPTPRPSHPPADHIYRLWRIFTERVDPLMKLIHVPSLQSAIEKAVINIEDIPAGFEALMFAIYSMAVLSLTEDECTEFLRETRAIMLSSFVAATKAALSRAGFMSSTSIVVLQALVLHIFSIRDTYDPRAVWSLTGLALRVAEGMGMRIDGTLLGLSLFETEIRRRVWWQLRMHDFRAAELAGQAKFRDFEIDETTPKKPANVNDSDLSPVMRQAPPESTKPTEMTWCALRSDLATFAHTQMARMRKRGKAGLASEEYAALDDLQLKDKSIKEMEDLIETKYLRFCDPSQPLHLMTLLGARLSLNLVRFQAHHPRRWAKLEHVSASEQEFVWGTVLQLLEQYNMLQSNPQLRRFAWNTPYFIQWHAVIHVLDTLQADPLRLDAEKAWGLIDALYQNNPDMLLSINKPIVAAVGNLCLRAYSARAGALAKQKGRLPGPPEYINKLRELREVAKARVEGRIARSKGQEAIGGEARLTRTEANVTWPDTNPRPVEARVEASRQQYPVAKQPPNPIPGSTLTQDDAFWLSDALVNSNIASGAAEMMNLDMDTILAEDYWLDTSNGDGIDWGQWDAWFGNPDPMRSNIGTGPR
ncbi:mitogen-activated protein kinase [Rhizodiscina lignyota]|uniref:Mitogen-activated protein kinase n=1 Tax=Rhizodiscina lignyota TaxID=1504668 RepID=A0A9P4M4E4_9PEZI|nr:mitogen-activated protein kinase [Rhizodiscina lignyota]